MYIMQRADSPENSFAWSYLIRHLSRQWTSKYMTRAEMYYDWNMKRVHFSLMNNEPP